MKVNLMTIDFIGVKMLKDRKFLMVTMHESGAYGILSYPNKAKMIKDFHEMSTKKGNIQLRILPLAMYKKI